MQGVDNRMQNDQSRARKSWRAALGPTPDCPDIERIGLFSDGRLPEQEAAGVSAHLVSCAHCRSELVMLQEFQSGITGNEERSEVEWIAAELSRRSGQIYPRRDEQKAIQPVPTG